MVVTDRQVRLLKMTYEKTGDLETASAKAGMCRQTGGKYLKGNKPRSALKSEHAWRTRPDPFAEDLRNAKYESLFVYIIFRQAITSLLARACGHRD